MLASSVSASQTRDEFHAMVLGDLLGPAGGPEEELEDSRVSWRYLIGWLAPRNTPPFPESEDEGELEAVTGDDGAEGEPDSPRPPSASMLPNSMGFTFRLEEGTESLRVRARWGWYRRRESETGFETPTGLAKQVWYRTPVEAETTITPAPGALCRWSPLPEVPEVVAEGRAQQAADGSLLVTLFLVNGQEKEGGGDDRWLFQAGLEVEHPDGRACFAAREPAAPGQTADFDAESLRMAYRGRREFAVGHGVSVEWDLGETPDRAVRIRTAAAPTCDLPRIAPTHVEGLTTRMAALAAAEPAELPGMLNPLTTAYRAWIARQEARAAAGSEGLAEHQATAKAALERARRAADRIQAGIDLLAADGNAVAAFRFANRAMHLQRIRGLFSQAVRRGRKTTPTEIEAGEAPAWYPFQLAFLLLNLPGLTRPEHPERSGVGAPAELLWFPTGGGKTEAYLGLTAYTLAMRRLQGKVGDGLAPEGVAVLMRYTLRLLTLQQFQRATALLCACETIRRGDPERWGETPFRIGLWLGHASTPNRFEQAERLLEHGGGSGTLNQLPFCPWCGAEIVQGRDIRADPERRRVVTYCGDRMGRCDFSEAKAPGEGLPACVVDEDVYRLLPGLVIATVDKFAQLPWNGETQMLFGRVDRRCPRHGFLCPSSDHDAGRHTATGRLPAATVEPCGRLRPPDLIIQDELHLITGPLGSLVGIYETAVDALCAWESGGERIRPKVVVSTATVSRAPEQVDELFRRDLQVFPPRGLDAGDDFFSVQSEESPGTRYVGICATGRRLKAALIQTYVASLCAAQVLLERYGEAADPYMTLVGYFNSLRELGGMRRLLEDDVRSRAGKMNQRGLAKRNIRQDRYDELTSRKSARDIPRVLDRLERGFPPAREAKEHPLDILIATNMISVGVDVPRLGLMVVAGQPKLSAEYIQATSRIGRRHPGVVFTVFNWVRPRDLSHYERFRHFHATLQRHVEGSSVTPFSPGARRRGLSAVLAALARLSETQFNANGAAQALGEQPVRLDAARKAIRERAAGRAPAAAAVDAELAARADHWEQQAAQAALGHGPLAFREDRSHVVQRALLREPDAPPWRLFTCPHSLREVELHANLALLEQDVEPAPSEDEDPAEDGEPAP